MCYHLLIYSRYSDDDPWGVNPENYDGIYCFEYSTIERMVWSTMKITGSLARMLDPKSTVVAQS